jgi:hypothetical protein
MPQRRLVVLCLAKKRIPVVFLAGAGGAGGETGDTVGEIAVWLALRRAFGLALRRAVGSSVGAGAGGTGVALCVGTGVSTSILFGDTIGLVKGVVWYSPVCSSSPSVSSCSYVGWSCL